ncbi:sensor histidine kinase [Dyella silvae]|uniref:sensor histidine kinase n=1 Tax=Dyella silvae TaxID=2994424 RepID=UPI00226443FB|nr:ATP-binding protein [Dyella silvae]
MKAETRREYEATDRDNAVTLRRATSHATATQVATRLMQRLHDGPAQWMTLALLELDQARQAPFHVGAQTLDGLRELVSEALRGTRQVLQEWDCGTVVARSMPLAASLIHLGRRLSSFTGLALYIDCDDSVPDPPKPVATIVLQAAQELLLNTCKHAPGANAQLVLRATAHGFELTVGDDGPGFDPVTIYQRHSQRGGWGLGAMPERLAHADAAFDLQAAPGAGVQACIRWPGDFAEQYWKGRRMVRIPGRKVAR